MCFNQKYSAAFALMGTVALALVWKNKKLGHNLLFVPLIFYTIMELLQTVQYSYVNSCNKVNRFLTEISYLLVVVQPIMWNLIFLFKKRSVRLTDVQRGILICAVTLCGVWIVAHFLRRFNFYGKNLSKENESLSEITSGPKTCTFKKEDEHLYWTYEIFSNPGMDANWFMYLVLWFIPGFMIPGERSTVLFLLAGFLASWAYVKINNHTRHITPSLWCLTSAPTLALNVAYALMF